MSRLIRASIALLVVAFAAPASAQVRDHRRKPRRDNTVVVVRFEARDFLPKSGPVGTEVAVSGSGFTKDMTVLFGGRRVKVKKFSATEIRFDVPSRYGDGRIVLRKPGSAKEIDAGTFNVLAPPSIVSVSPASGSAGSRVAIRGDFEKGDQVLLNNRPIPIVRFDSRRIIVTIPGWATTDYLVVSRASGTQARSPKQFVVLQPAPTISSLSPSHGPPGTIVRISGANFPDKVQVFYGRHPARVLKAGADWVEAEVPTNARRSRFFRVRAATGEARASQDFELELPPFVSRFEPAFGTAGSRVTIIGDNFRPGDTLELAGQRLRIEQLDNGRITVIIPRNARSGRFTVSRGSLSSTSRQDFTVDVAPAITSFSPAAGPAGTHVTIRGSGFANAEVTFGGAKLRILRRIGDNTLEVEIPRRVDRKAPFVVSNRGGQATSTQDFTVQVFPVVTSISPLRGGVGTNVTIKGDRLGRIGRVFIGSIEMPILSRGKNLMVVEVPSGASDDVISWMSFGRKFDGRWRFDMLVAPTVRSFAPASGAPGTDVVIRGSDFHRSSRVFFGSTAVRVLRSSPDQLTVRLPGSISGSDFFIVESEGMRTSSRDRFQVVVPPLLRGFTPRVAKPGSQVEVFGVNFDGTTRVLLDDQPLKVVTTKGDRITVEIPANARPGKAFFSVSGQGASDRSRRPFIVEPFASIDSFSPQSVKPGQKVNIRGRGFDNGVRILFGRNELQVVKVDRRGRKIEVVVPDGVTGKDVLVVDDAGNRSRSADTLEVTAPPPPPKIRDHRNKPGRGPKIRDHRHK